MGLTHNLWKCGMPLSINAFTRYNPIYCLRLVCEQNKYIKPDSMVYLHSMVTHNTLRTQEGKYVFSEKKKRLLITLDIVKCLNNSNNRDCSYVHTYFWITVYHPFSRISGITCLYPVFVRHWKNLNFFYFSFNQILPPPKMFFLCQRYFYTGPLNLLSSRPGNRPIWYPTKPWFNYYADRDIAISVTTTKSFLFFSLSANPS